MMEVREDRRSARSEAREAAAAGYTSLGCTGDTASVGKGRLSCPCSSEFSAWRAQREKEPQVAKKRTP